MFRMLVLIVESVFANQQVSGETCGLEFSWWDPILANMLVCLLNWVVLLHHPDYFSYVWSSQNDNNNSLCSQVLTLHPQCTFPRVALSDDLTFRDMGDKETTCLCVCVRVCVGGMIWFIYLFCFSFLNHHTIFTLIIFIYYLLFWNCRNSESQSPPPPPPPPPPSSSLSSTLSLSQWSTKDIVWEEVVAPSEDEPRLRHFRNLLKYLLTVVYPFSHVWLTLLYVYLYLSIYLLYCHCYFLEFSEASINKLQTPIPQQNAPLQCLQVSLQCRFPGWGASKKNTAVWP